MRVVGLGYIVSCQNNREVCKHDIPLISQLVSSGEIERIIEDAASFILDSP